MSKASHAAALAGLLLSTATLAGAQPAPATPPQPAGAAADALLAGFADPPMSARPRVWWHWLNGNITEDGIRADLEWMRRTGIGGAQNFDASLGTPQVVEHRLAFMTPEWRHAFRFAASEADRLGLELAIAASPGWSETGGPWVPPQDAMKKLVWSETIVEGGRHFTGELPAPPAVTGPFQSIAFAEPFAIPGAPPPAPPPAYHADVAVLAYPLGPAAAEAAPRASTSSGQVLDAAALADDRPETGVAVERGSAEEPGALILAFSGARTIRSATLYIPNAVQPFRDPELRPVLEVREGGGWRRIGEFPLTRIPTTIGFAPATGTEFRVLLAHNNAPGRVDTAEPAPGAIDPAAMFAGGAGPPPTIDIGEFSLSSGAKVDRFEAKAGFDTALDYYALSAGLPEEAGVDPGQIVDLTARMRPDGSLDWTPPPGRWRVLRFGMSLLGTTNHPATPEATGLEVDKYDGAAVRRYLETYLGMYRDAAGADLMGARGLSALLTDSIEAGDANWTPRMIEQFRRLRGYDPTLWLPALAGVIIGSRARTDAFLYDYRRTLADLLASEHYGTVAIVAREHGLRLYGEALEDARPGLGDDMAMRRHTDIPMAAMWTYGRALGPRPTMIGDIRGAASVAHIYGQNLVAAESMTSIGAPWAHAPFYLKSIIDLELVTGVNRPVIHTSVHSPMDDREPGLSLAIFGQYFNRHETWAEMARPWIDYIARSSWLLQQGRNHADLAYFYGEEQPLTALFARAPLAGLPTRYAYDFVNADALDDALSVEDGALATPGGARYRALYLGGTSRRMTLRALRRIAALAEAGATIIGRPPSSSPSLADDQAAFDGLVRHLWSGGRETAVGQGRVIASDDIEASLGAAGLTPDFDYVKPRPDSEVLFLHRRLPDGHVYFLSNRRDRPERIEARFRVTGLAPSLWRADTGTVETVSYRTEGDRTLVPLDLGPDDAVFVVFRGAPAAPSATVAAPVWRPVASVAGAWHVAFQPNRGAPAAIDLPALAPLNENGDAGVRYFSGVATYTTAFSLPRGVRPGAPLRLDLGRVGDIAEVRVNGRLVGTAWHAPFQVDIGGAVHPGPNRLEIRVADLWANRLIGDARPGAQRVAWTAIPSYRPDAPLRPAGLIGPVTLVAATAAEAR